MKIDMITSKTSLIHISRKAYLYLMFHIRSIFAWRFMAGKAIGLAFGLVLVAGEVHAQATPPAREVALQARLGAIEAKLLDLTTTMERMAARQARDRAPNQGDSARAPDRFVLAAMHLQTIVASGRPFLREWHTLRGMAPEGAIPGPLADVLTSHAARGLPTPLELRESFAELMPRMIARSDEETGFGNWLQRLWQRLLFALSLGDVPPMSTTRLTLAHVEMQLTRGQLAAALGELETLDPGLQPLLAGWLVKARARVAAEQAVQETILHALTRPN